MICFCEKSIKFFPVFFIFFFLSCQGPLKEIDSTEARVNNKDFFVKNGIVHFYDSDSYIRTLDYISNLEQKAKIDFCNNNNFVSFFYTYNELLQSVESSQKKDYKKYVTFDNNTPKLNFVTPVIAAVANQDGLLFIGKQLVRFVDNKEIVVKDGSIDKAMNWANYTDKDRLVINTSVLTLNR